MSTSPLLEAVAALVAALGTAILATASIIALAITRGQLKVANKQRDDSIFIEKVRITLAYVEDFRRGKYQVSTERIGQTLEITPDCAISVCGSLMSDDNFVHEILLANKDPHLRDLFIQLASVAYNFCQQTAILIWRGRIDEDLLLDFLSGPILQAATTLERLAEMRQDLRSRLDTYPFRLLVALARKRAGESVTADTQSDH
jgi:hypothetical protein